MNFKIRDLTIKYKLIIGIITGIILLGFPFIITSQYLLRISIMVGIYMILASSLNIVNGFAGMFSLGHGAFFGIGAYTSALITIHLGIPFWVAMIASGIVAGIFGAFLGLATLRLRAIFLAFATLGFGEITRIIVLNWISLTRGPMGITGIPIPKILGLTFDSNIYYYYFVLLFLIFTIVIIYRLYNSRIGRSFVAIREDEIAAKSMGVYVFGNKILAFTIACFIAGMAGSLYAHFARYISADQFGINESFSILTMVALGGTGSIAGPLIGALTLVLLPEIFRFLVEFRMVLYGVILILVMVIKPEGIAGVKGIFSRPSNTMKPKSRKKVGEAE